MAKKTYPVQPPRVSREYLAYKASSAAANKIIAQVKAIEVAGSKRRIREANAKNLKYLDDIKKLNAWRDQFEGL